MRQVLDLRSLMSTIPSLLHLMSTTPPSNPIRPTQRVSFPRACFLLSRSVWLSTSRVQTPQFFMNFLLQPIQPLGLQEVTCRSPDLIAVTITTVSILLFHSVVSQSSASTSLAQDAWFYTRLSPALLKLIMLTTPSDSRANCLNS